MEALKSTCASTDRILVVSYSRKTLRQTGDGHFSPIGGYDPDTNSVLVLDVARFKVRYGRGACTGTDVGNSQSDQRNVHERVGAAVQYPSYWVSADLLWYVRADIAV